MSTGPAAGNSGDHSVSSAPVHVSGEPDTQTRLDRPAAPSHTRSGEPRSSKVWFEDREYWVYTHFDADGSVLYVGCTSQRKGRELTHATSSPWYPDVAETLHEGPLSRYDGYELERTLIKRYDPPHNFFHTSRYVHPTKGPEKWVPPEPQLEDECDLWHADAIHDAFFGFAEAVTR